MVKRVQGDIPKKINVAFSGGVDSVAVAWWLKQRNHEIKLHYFHHHLIENPMLDFVKEFSDKYGFDLNIGYIKCDLPKGRSKEDFWREHRYNFLNEVPKDEKIITCHHLDDCVETYIFNALRGKCATIPYSRDNIIRPFRLSEKKYFINYIKPINLEWYEDETNQDQNYTRNYIRHTLRSQCERVNPGLATTVRKMIEAEFISE